MKKRLALLSLFVAFMMGLVACAPGEMLNTIIWGNTEDTTYQPIVSDPMTHTIAVISYPHYEIHEGCSFTTFYTDDTMADAETIIFVFKTMAGTNRVHMLAEFVTLVGGYVEIWEDPTWTTGTGVLNPIINRKREVVMNNSGVLEDLTATPVFTATDNVLVAPTGLNTAGATSIHKHYAWGEKGKIGARGQRDTDELILKPDTQYAVVFTAIGNANKAEVILDWYEHTDSP